MPKLNNKTNEKLNEKKYQKIVFPVKTKDGTIYTTLLKCIKKQEE